jgi:hypothetical protein
MNPLQINFNCWRFFLVPRRFSRVTCGRFDLAFEWLYCHELVSLNLKVVIELVCFLIFLKCFLFLHLSFFFGFLLLDARKVHSSVIQIVIKFNILFIFLVILHLPTCFVKLTIIV